jgi:hypothetical protein
VSKSCTLNMYGYVLSFSSSQEKGGIFFAVWLSRQVVLSYLGFLSVWASVRAVLALIIIVAICQARRWVACLLAPFMLREGGARALHSSRGSG